MATKLDDFTPRHRGPKPYYPWDKWFDGSIWRLNHGEDFVCLSTSMGVLVRYHAKNRGYACTVYVEGRDVIIEPK